MSESSGWNARRKTITEYMQILALYGFISYVIFETQWILMEQGGGGGGLHSYI